jgi:DNA adenine methylase
MARSSTTFSGKWKSGATTVIRVPELLADVVLRYARELDATPAACEPQAIHRTAADVSQAKPVNVASVPQRSPFRYPGGKTWLVPYVRSWLLAQPARPRVLVEPFAGGGIVGLTAGFERLADHVVLVEKDPDVASVWKAMLHGQGEWLASRIETFDLTRENVLAVLNGGGTSQRERAFATILRNRVQRGGIMARGAGLVKTGENGRGLNSRWYPETLARRIRDIVDLAHRFAFVEGDALEAIRAYSDDEGAAFFIDPPYLVAAKRLYTHWDVDHAALFDEVRAAKGSCLMTYDNAPEIAELARQRGMESATIAMKNTHHEEKRELLISGDLAWLRHGRA